jgi:prolyl-tRNA editing enzyme YbaK/EbsC (Cys-tRNA(Pro) deacylase)
MEMSRALDLVSSYLDDNAVECEMIEHEQRFTAAAEARAAGVEPGDAAKDVVLHAADAYVLAVIPPPNGSI